ncbi:unnamed protein product [Malus baccata var. baccata]
MQAAYSNGVTGCIFASGTGLMSFVHPVHKARETRREDDNGLVCGVMFPMGLCTRIPSIPCTGSESNSDDKRFLTGEFLNKDFVKKLEPLALPYLCLARDGEALPALIMASATIITALAVTTTTLAATIATSISTTTSTALVTTTINTFSAIVSTALVTSAAKTWIEINTILLQFVRRALLPFVPRDLLPFAR